MTDQLQKLPIPMPAINHHIQQALRTQRNEESQHHPKRHAISMGDIGKCQRELYYKLHGVEDEKPINDDVLQIFAHGKLLEEHVISLLILADFNVQPIGLNGKQFWHDDLGGRIRGYSDGKILLDQWATLEIKSANLKSFERVCAVGYEQWNQNYYSTLQGYMGTSECRKALVVVYHKNGSAGAPYSDLPNIYAEVIQFDPDHYRRDRNKCEMVLDAKSVPERPLQRAIPGKARSRGCKDCVYCPFKEHCWNPTTEIVFDD